MTITISYLGAWERYVPDIRPAGALSSALFSRRLSDGADWYDLIRDPATFAPDDIIATCDHTQDGYLVQAVVRDASLLFPQAGQIVIVIKGVDPTIEKPHLLFRLRIVDVETGTFTLPNPIPQSMSPLQARKALRIAGLKAAVDDYVGTLPEEEREEWEYATEVRRDNAIIAAGAAALSMTSEQVDDLFRLGVTL